MYRHEPTETIRKTLRSVVPPIEETLSIENPLEQLRSGLSLVQKALATLRIELTKNSFTNREEEIYFFKKGRPQIHSLLILTTERYAIETVCLFWARKSSLHISNPSFSLT